MPWRSLNMWLEGSQRQVNALCLCARERLMSTETKQNGGFYLYQRSWCHGSLGNLRVFMSTLRNSFRRKKRRSAQELEICPVGSIYIQVYYRCIGYLSWSVLPCYVIVRDVLFLNFELEGNLIFYLLVYKAEIVWCICMSAVSQCVIGYNIHVVNIYM